MKSQWRAEITRFCDRSVQIVAGKTAERASQYGSSAFFTVAKYRRSSATPSYSVSRAMPPAVVSHHECGQHRPEPPGRRYRDQHRPAVENPALLEQRIARAHRMGQKRKVQVYLMVTEGTIEENLLATLSAKHELAAAVLDPDSDLSEVQLVSGMDELKRRLEVLLGAKPEGDPDISVQRRVDAALTPEHKAKVAEASGQLVSAAFSFLSTLMPATAAPAPETVEAMRSGLAQCAESNPDGSLNLNLKLPNAEALTAMATALAALLTPQK